MLYLITGANGAGKTLNTLKWVRELQLKENRPVCHNGRFEPVEGGELSTWKKIEMDKWQDEPDGTIFLVDECHNDFPVRPASSTPPDYVRMLAEHRRRGFDFYLVTQHPQNIDSFVRRLVGSPGWHRHLKRTFGADLVSVLEWPAVNPNCEKDGSGKSGTVSMVGFPKEVYAWYKSASLHTARRRIPRSVWVLAVCALLVPVLGFYGYKTVYGNVTKRADQRAVPVAVASNGQGAGRSSEPMTVAEYVEARTPRLPGFPHTSPAYDEVTRPVVAPYPAACIEMGERCDCFTQQATLMRVALSTCRQIVAQGFFVDWQQAQQPQQGQAQAGVHWRSEGQQPAQQVRSVPVPDVPSPQSGQITQADVAHALRVRNPAFAAVPSGVGRMSN